MGVNSLCVALLTALNRSAAFLVALQAFLHSRLGHDLPRGWKAVLVIGKEDRSSRRLAFKSPDGRLCRWGHMRLGGGCT